MFYAKIFPISVSVISFWLEFHVPSPYFGAETEKVNLFTIMNLSCFSLYLFIWFSFFLFLKIFQRGVVLLDNPSWMRVGELLEGLDIEYGDLYPSTKKEVSKSVIAIIAIRILYGAISNKPVNQSCLKE